MEDKKMKVKINWENKGSKREDVFENVVVIKIVPMTTGRLTVVVTDNNNENIEIRRPGNSNFTVENNGNVVKMFTPKKGEHERRERRETDMNDNLTFAPNEEEMIEIVER